MSCELCGGPVVVQGSLTGTRYYVPVAEEALQKMMDGEQTDNFIRDRLRRAEKIIDRLREELSASSRRANLEGQGQTPEEGGRGV